MGVEPGSRGIISKLLKRCSSTGAQPPQRSSQPAQQETEPDEEEFVPEEELDGTHTQGAFHLDHGLAPVSLGRNLSSNRHAPIAGDGLMMAKARRQQSGRSIDDEL